jgi:hypothetical protein
MLALFQESCLELCIRPKQAGRMQKVWERVLAVTGGVGTLGVAIEE